MKQALEGHDDALSIKAPSTVGSFAKHIHSKNMGAMKERRVSGILDLIFVTKDAHCTTHHAFIVYIIYIYCAYLMIKCYFLVCMAARWPNG